MAMQGHGFRKVWIAAATVMATVFLLALLPGHRCFGQTSQQMVNLQGRLFDSNGNPLTGNYSMTFTYWNAVSGGDQLPIGSPFSETQTVAVNNGYYNVNIGAATGGGVPAAIFTNSNVWLQIVVGNETLAPRTRVVSSAYAFNADMLDGRNAGNASGEIPISNSVLCTNLNADLLDGQSGAFYRNASKLKAHPLTCTASILRALVRQEGWTSSPEEAVISLSGLVLRARQWTGCT